MMRKRFSPLAQHRPASTLNAAVRRFGSHLEKGGEGLSPHQNERRIDAFEAGEYDVIAVRDLLVEGWDSKRVLLALNLRPVYSPVEKTHMVGRVMRAREGKEAGIFVEFQDQYDKGQQPVLVHHIVGKTEYRQGGLLLAPKKKADSEETRILARETVPVRRNLSVSFDVERVVSIEADLAEPDFQDPKVVRKILRSRPDVDWFGSSPKDLLKVRFDHPLFKGGMVTLIHKVFGIRQKMGSQLRSVDDLKHLLWFAFEKSMIRRDNRNARLEQPAMGEFSHMPGNQHEMLEEAIGRNAVRDVIMRLPQAQREVMERLYVEGMEYEEVIDELGITPSCARARRQVAVESIKTNDSLWLREFVTDEGEYLGWSSRLLSMDYHVEVRPSESGMFTFRQRLERMAPLEPMFPVDSDLDGQENEELERRLATAEMFEASLARLRKKLYETRTDGEARHVLLSSPINMRPVYTDILLSRSKIRKPWGVKYAEAALLIQSFSQAYREYETTVVNRRYVRG
jgi:hypothetical protein